MKTTKIGIVGTSSSIDKLSLMLRQKTKGEIVKIKHELDLKKKVEDGSFDVIILSVSARKSAYSCAALKVLLKYYNSSNIIINSEVKDPDIMYMSLHHGVNKFIIDNGNVQSVTNDLIKEINLVLSSKKSRNILAIGAHPDDVEIGCGATLKKHKENGDNVTILTLTGGAFGGEVTVRKKESYNAAAALQAQLVMCDHQDTELTSGPETICSIETIIKNIRPDIIYTHSVNDTHQDHRATYYATLVAARTVKRIFSYLAPSGTIDFHPRYFEHIEDFIDDKMEAINCFTSQTIGSARPYLTRSIIESTAEYWGRFSNYGKVEPFEVIRA